MNLDYLMVAGMAVILYRTVWRTCCLMRQYRRWERDMDRVAFIMRERSAR